MDELERTSSVVLGGEVGVSREIARLAINADTRDAALAILSDAGARWVSGDEGSDQAASLVAKALVAAHTESRTKKADPTTPSVEVPPFDMTK